MLALFAPRNRLIEFVLQEDAYRADMMREIDRALLDRAGAVVRPQLPRAAADAAASQTMGIHKPWSPTRSYGLVVELDARLAAGRQPSQPRQRHAPWRHQRDRARTGAILAAAKGGDCILRVERQAGGRR